MSSELTKKLNGGNGFAKEHKNELLVAAAFLLTYFPTFVWMWHRWFVRDSYYSHGILIPFVSIYLIWQKKEELKRIAFKRSRWGIVLIVAGIAIHIASYMLRRYFPSGFSMIPVLIGLILYLYGEKFFKKIWFPIFFLFFMIPVPLVVITNISFQMKIFAAKVAAYLLNGMGFPAIRDGSMIIMKHTYVMVEDVCSGLRSLISLTALGSIFAHWIKSSLLKKTILFLSTIPIAIVTNVFRIVFLSVVSEIWGSHSATGFIHDFSGFLVFALAFVLLYSTAKLLE